LQIRPASTAGGGLDAFDAREGIVDEPEGEHPAAKARRSAASTHHHVHAPNSKVNQRDFILFDQKDRQQNREHQRLLGTFGIENLAMFFIKYRVDRNSVNDPFYQ